MVKSNKSKDVAALLEPSIIMEVLSDSTADYDRGDKFNSYKTIPTLEQYILVCQDIIQVENHRKLNEKQWLSTLMDNEAEKFAVLDCEISLQAIYEDTDTEIEVINEG